MTPDGAADGPAPTVVTRPERRKGRTRAALVAAAQRLLAEGRADVSIQEITATADVGFGTFYNHFTDKPQLWEAAIVETLRQHSALIETLTAGTTDPVEVFCVGLRLSGRLATSHPDIARILCNSGPAVLLSDHGYAPMALRDITAAARHGRFDVADPGLALAAAAGGLLGLLQLLEGRADAQADDLADEFARRMLRMCGLGKADADELVARPLPAPSAESCTAAPHTPIPSSGPRTPGR